MKNKYDKDIILFFAYLGLLLTVFLTSFIILVFLGSYVTLWWKKLIAGVLLCLSLWEIARLVTTFKIFYMQAKEYEELLEAEKAKLMADIENGCTTVTDLIDPFEEFNDENK